MRTEFIIIISLICVELFGGYAMHDADLPYYFADF